MGTDLSHRVQRGEARDRLVQDPSGQNRKAYIAIGVLMVVGIVFVAIRGGGQDGPLASSAARPAPPQAASVPVRATAAAPRLTLQTVEGRGTRVARLTLAEANYICAIVVERNHHRSIGGGDNFVVVMEGATQGYASSLLVNDITVNGRYEKIVKSAGGLFLFEVEAVAGAPWSISCVPQ